MRKPKTTKLLQIAFLASLSGCGVPGDFCDVVRNPVEFQNETARQIVKTDRAEAEQIATQNEYGNRFCDW